MTDARTVTLGFIVATTIVVILFDVFMKFYAGDHATISVVLYEEACRHPSIAVAIGIVVGHIFWPTRDGTV